MTLPIPGELGDRADALVAETMDALMAAHTLSVDDDPHWVSLRFARAEDADRFHTIVLRAMLLAMFGGDRGGDTQ